MAMIDRLKRRKRRFRRSLILAVSSAVLVSLASYVGYFDRLESWALDLLFRLRGQAYSSEIVLVQIDEEAFHNLKERQPLSRAYLASLVNVVSPAGAKVIGIDIELNLPTDPKDDKLLIDAIEKAKENGNSKVVPMYSLSAETEKAERASPSYPLLFARTLETVAGFGNATIDARGAVREVPLAAKTSDGRVLPSFAIAVLARYAGYNEKNLDQAMNSGKRVELSLPEVDRLNGKLLPNPTRFSFRLNETWKINYVGAQGSFAVIPSEPLSQLAGKKMPPAQDNPFRGKVVLIGATFRDSQDFHPTPYGIMSGVEVHANIINTLLTRAQIRPVHRALSFLVLLLFALLTSVLLTVYSPAAVRYGSMIAIPIISIPLSYLALTYLGLWVDFITPLLLIRFGTMAGDFFQQRHLRSTLREYVNDEVARHIVNQEDAFLDKTKEVTVLFTDLQNYTTLAESLPPERVFGIMNQLFIAMGDVIARHGGTVIDFIGDSVLAAFGAVRDNPDHARDAVKAAVEIQHKLKVLNEEWQKRTVSPLHVRVGIHTGEVFAGIIGSGMRKKYNLAGDTVNAGARVQELNKQFGTSILITRDTLERLGGTLHVRPCGEVQVKGRQKPVEVFEVACADDQDVRAEGNAQCEEVSISDH